MLLFLKTGGRTTIKEKNGKTALHEAAENNASECARLLLDYGANPEALDNQSRTPLIVTASHDSKDTALLLLQRGAKTEAMRKDGMAAIHVAVKSGSLATLKLLLEHGADVDSVVQKHTLTSPKQSGCFPQNMLVKSTLSVELASLKHGSFAISFENAGWTALHLAAVTIGSGPESTQVLLGYQANLNVIDKDGQTPLHMAAKMKNNLNTIQLLLEYGANVNAIDFAGLTALHVACAWRRIDAIVKLLAGGANVNLTDWKHRTPAHLAAENTAHVATKLLLNHGAHVNAVDQQGQSLLHSACRSGSYMTVEVLLNCSALVDTTNNKGRTPLFEAVEIGHEEITKLLLKHGANVNILDKNGDHILHVALQKPILRILEPLLLQPGIFVNVGDNSGNCAIHYLVQCAEEVLTDRRSFIRVIGELLVRQGVVVNSRNHLDLTPLHLARSLTAVEFLVENGAWPNVTENHHGDTPLIVRAKNTLGSDWLFYEGASSDTVFNKMATAFVTDNLKKQGRYTLETQRGITECAKEKIGNLSLRNQWGMLLKMGFDPWIASSDGSTLIGALLVNKKFALARKVIRCIVHGNEQTVNTTHTNGDTILHVLCACGEDEAQELVDQVLKYGAKCNARNSKQETPLHVVCRSITQRKDMVGCTVSNTASQTSSTAVPRTPMSNIQEDITDTFFFWTAGRLLSHGADASLKDALGATSHSISETLPQLRQLLRKPVDINTIPPLLKWSEPKSPKHKAKVAQVVRGQKSVQIQSYHYHCEPIGAGAFGHVYVGVDERDGREIAIKCIDKQKLNRSEEEREISSLLALKDCEQVVRYLCYLKDNSWAYIVLELMEGTLEEYLDIRTDSSLDLVLCNDMLRGLAYLHHRSVLHRDIKPSNFLYKTTPKVG